MEKLEIHPMDQSICASCKSYMFRRIIPLNFEAYEIVEMEDDDIIEAEQHTCMLLNMDLDHIVLECNKFEEYRGPFFGKHDFN